MVRPGVILETDKLTIGYKEARGEKIILRDIDLHLRSGELICMMGPNGIGKSTMIRTLCGLQDPLRGKVSISGRDLTSISENERSRLVSVVLTDRVQGGNLTVRELIEMGRYPHMNWMARFSSKDGETIDRAIESISLSDILESKLHQLSDGQFQRAMIARALVQDGEIMILDEPTAHLDLNNRVEVMRLLRKLAHRLDKSVLMATHELDLALQLADRLILVQPDGSILEGIPEDMVLNGSLDRTFKLKGYDLRTGKAEFKPDKELEIHLVAEGYYYLWAKNALERNGYRVSTGSDKGIVIQVIASDDSFKCVLDFDNKSLEFKSFEDLISFLATV